MDDSASTGERWLPVSGYEGLYEVSDLGRVRGLDRVTIRKDGRARRFPGMILNPWSENGYPVVKLSKNCILTRYPVHVLVLTEFVGPRPAGQEARHGPAGKADASLRNLCWGTRSENVRDRTRDGQDNRGERHGIAVLTRAIVLDLRRRAEAGERQCDLAAEYRLNRKNVWMVVHRKSWTWL